jgi:hypothetical protein
VSMLHNSMMVFLCIVFFFPPFKLLLYNEQYCDILNFSLFFSFLIGNKNFIRSEKTLPSAQIMHLQERKDYKRETHINQQ